MSKVSKRILNKELENHIFELFIKTISDLKSKEAVKNFLDDLLSPSEKIMLVKRLAIAIMLAKGYTYDLIDDTLKVSRPTITNVSFWLKYGKNGYKKVVDSIFKKQKRDDVIDKIEELLLKISPPKAYGSFEFKVKQKRGRELVERRRKKIFF